MLKNALFCLLFFVSVFAAFGQVGVDPSDSFYDQVEIWEAQGLVRDLPPLRPYPVAVIKDILQTVMSSSNELAVQKAKQFSEKIFAKPFHVAVEGEGNFKFSDDKNAKQALGFAGISGDAAFLKAFSASYKLNFAGTINSDASVLPVFASTPHTFRDPADLGPLELFLEMDGSIAYGSPRFYVQGGISHNSFGPFYGRSVVFSPDAQHTANFSVVVNPGRWSYTHGMFVLGASNNAGEGVYPNKFMMLHSIEGRIFDWLTASFYETIVYGDRFDPSYFVPMPFMVAQGITGFDDNLMMGVSFTIKPFAGLSWSTDIFIDDISLNDVFKFDFDTKIRGALQTGIKYAPLGLPVLKLVQLDYTLVTPYMYAHKQNIYSPYDGDYVIGGTKAINYQTYNNVGTAIGSQLAPNSDRVFLSVSGEPVQGLNITLTGAFIRHANVNESITTQEAIDYLNAPADYFLTDGTINNHPYVGFLRNDATESEGDPNDLSNVDYKYMSSGKSRLMFMTQDTKMYVVQAGLNVSYDFPAMSFGQFSVGVGYMFEYIKNWGVQNNMFPGSGDSFKKTATEADVASAVADWKAQLKDVVNNYVTVSVKYKY